MTPTFSIIVATCGRPTLSRTLESLAPQIEHGDEILVIRNDEAPWGHATRQEALSRAKGSHLWFMDDDDIAADFALTEIRLTVAEQPDRVHIFLMKQGDVVFGLTKMARVGHIGTPMVVVPNQEGKLGRWGTRYESDGDFFLETLALRDEDPVWHDQIVALIRP